MLIWANLGNLGVELIEKRHFWASFIYTSILVILGGDSKQLVDYTY